jgi:UDPglucose--hexose-1-phosphate uridylyltransferase
MEWGIINKDNFTSIRDVPIKRWDPLSTVKISDKDFGLRKTMRYSGHYSYISPIRGKRPKSYKSGGKNEIDFGDCSKLSKSSINDVFTAVTEGKPLHDENGTILRDGNTIIITQDDVRRDNPFLEHPHKIQRIADDCKAITLINRYPSMARIIDPDIQNKIHTSLPQNSKLSMGINLLTISRNFYPALCFHLIPEDVLAGIFLSMKAAILYSIEYAIERDYYNIPVYPFFNIGIKVGGSQPRIHSQCYIDLNGDGHGSHLDSYLQAFEEIPDECHLCVSTHGNGSRIVLESEYWRFFATGSPVRNYHLRFYPKEHIRRFSNLKPNQIQDLARSLKTVFQALDSLKIERSRNIIFNSCPYGYDADFHMFGDIIPHEIIGGAEMADDMRVARKLPENAAREIKDFINGI